MATTYYVSTVDGDDSHNGLYSTDQGGSNGPWLTISRADNLSGDQSDNSVLFRRGGTWREYWGLACNGTSGHPFTIGAYDSGNLPRILGSTLLTSWTLDSGDIWKAACAYSVIGAFFLKTDSSIGFGDYKSAKVNLENEYDYFSDGSDLYIFSPSNPNTRYNGVEAGIRDRIINGTSKGYITISYIEAAYSRLDLLKNYQGNGWTIDHCHVHHCNTRGMIVGASARAILMQGCSDCWIHHNLVHDSGWTGIFFNRTGTYPQMNNNTIEYNEVYNATHTNIDFIDTSTNTNGSDGLIIRYNFSYFTSDYLPGELSDHIFVKGAGNSYVTNVKIHYNIGIKAAGSGVCIYNDTRNVEIYNNTMYGTLPGIANMVQGIFIKTDATIQPSNVKIKNNINGDIYSGTGGGDRCFELADADSISECDYNLWYQPTAGRMVAKIETTIYRTDDFAQYKSDTGWDTHGFWEDPKLVNAGGTSAADYKLASDSPLIDTGADVDLTLDYWGNTVDGTPEIGAHELTKIDLPDQAVTVSEWFEVYIYPPPPLFVDIDEAVEVEDNIIKVTPTPLVGDMNINVLDDIHVIESILNNFSRRRPKRCGDPHYLEI